MKKFIFDTIERAAKTAAQTTIATIGTATLLSSIDWHVVASTVAVATMLSVLTSIASRPIGNTDSASIVDKED